MENRNNMKSNMKYVLISLIFYLGISINSFAQENRLFLIDFQTPFLNDTVSLKINGYTIFSNEILKSNRNFGLTSMQVLFTKTDTNICHGYFVASLVSSKTYKIRQIINIRKEQKDVNKISIEIKVNDKILATELTLFKESFIGVEFENDQITIEHQKREFEYD